MSSAFGTGAGAALYEAFRRRPQSGEDQHASPGYDELDASPEAPMGTIQTMARAMPQPRQPQIPQIAASESPATGAFDTPTGETRPRRVLSAASASLPAQPRESYLSTRALSPRPPVTPTVRAYGKYEDEAAALPTEQQYIEQHQPHGALARLASALKLAGRTLVSSGLNPIYAAEGLGIGLIDKNANAREMYRDYVEPRSVDRQRRHLSMANAELGMQNTRADNARADEQLQMSGEQHAAGLDIQRATLQDRERQWTERLQEKTLNDWMLRNAGRPIPRSIAASSGHPELEGYVPPQKVANGPQPHFQYNQATGETAVVESDGNGGWKITRPQGEAMQPTPERPTREPLEDYKAKVGPEAYGAKSWNDLIDNPAYGPAYQQALESAKAMTSSGGDPVKMLNTLIGGGRIKLPPRQITVYEYAKQNPHPLQSAAVAARNGEQRNRRLSPRSSSTTPSATAANKTFTADQLRKYVDATPPNAQGRKPTIDEARTFLRSKGYIVP